MHAMLLRFSSYIPVLMLKSQWLKFSQTIFLKSLNSLLYTDCSILGCGTLDMSAAVQQQHAQSWTTCLWESHGIKHKTFAFGNVKPYNSKFSYMCDACKLQSTTLIFTLMEIFNIHVYTSNSQKLHKNNVPIIISKNYRKINGNFCTVQ